ncbi:ABC transporter substrate-binding protein [Pikeienuella piscinae]|uniref:ABC transporter substrate-binding protein n=1 Tax=Pikeienuella piscinae TaxID=2748098 RepID=A0A7L5BXG5_9RHOB|nr:ABC transporter substrate-binding protein [Pikeienuella piscinae]QIE56615.1 ABC transporter substrate-binding protein [Pikeienuella piscinae]
MAEHEKSAGPSTGRRRFLKLSGAAALGVSAPFSLFGARMARAAGGQLRVRIGSDISVLDPALIFQIENQTVASHVYNGLVKYDQATNAITPDLAAEWEVSEDGRTYTFHLKDGVAFHKGYGALKASDVKFSFDRVRDEATGSRYRGQFASIDSVEAPDDRTVVIRLKNANSGFLHKVCAFNQGWIVSEKAVTEKGEAYKLDPIGTGPFIFDSWTAGTSVRMVANPEYFEGAPQIGEVVLRLIKDETASAIALENGEIDIAFALQQPQVIDRLKAADGVTMLSREANNTVNLVLNTTIAPLDDVRVRRAIIHALNRKGLIDGFFMGTKAEAHSVLTPTFQEYSQDVPTYDYDPDKARALLKEAGAEGFEFEIVTVALNPYDKFPVPMADDLNRVGINTKITVLERGAYVEARASGRVKSCITAVVGPPDPDSPLVTLYSTVSFPPGLNTSQYAGVDDLLAAASAEQDLEKRKALYEDVLQKTMEDVPVAPIYADRLFMAHSDKVGGLVQNSLFTVDTYSVSLTE